MKGNGRIYIWSKRANKKYRGTLALDHINLILRRGEIYGFIGENGAGKTTTIRLITGLSFPTEGHIALFGKSGEKELQKQRARIGCMVETPALYKNMTAEQNLEAQRIQRGIPDKECIGEVLKLVGLSDTGEKPFAIFRLVCVSGLVLRWRCWTTQNFWFWMNRLTV